MPRVPQLVGLTYHIKTFGCQMNLHDSERVSGLLDDCGLIEVSTPEEADVVIFMTCCVRENADTRLYGQASALVSMVAPPSGRRVLGVGGCIAQRDGAALRTHIPNVDFVFGTSALSSVPELLVAALEGKQGRGPLVDIEEQGRSFSTDLPSHRAQDFHAWVPIMTGCNNFCTYCIVPYVRGREKSRPLEEIVAEASLLVADGVREITLLGQNVNSYGRDIYGRSRFADVLRAVGETGIERLRFATSHPKDLLDETIAAMAEVPAVMPQLHLPVQSGSNRILNLMNRVYTREDYLGLVERLRRAVPDIALSTDIIVGFPGETERDFEDTLDLARQVGYAQAFTFIYSPRTGTPAAQMEQTATHEQIQDRFDRLVAVIQDTAHACNQVDLGTVQRVLVEGASRRDPSMLSGRSEKNQVVHAPLPMDALGSQIPIERLTGTMVDVRVDTARTWYLSGEVVALPEGQGRANR